jgi:hypothetical protein
LLVAIAIGVLANRNASRAATPPTTVATRATTSPNPSTRRSSPASTTAGGSPRTLLLPLTVAEPSHRESYVRAADFGGWADVRGCQDTRATLLIRLSQVPVTFASAAHCTVRTGRWVDRWSGAVATVARDLQVDHTVPLGNAWRSGAWSWTHEQRVAYANDLADTDHLVPILAHENESKRDDGPESWRPPNRSSWCRYALAWDHIKATWHLTATAAEWTAVREMSATC